MARSAGIVLMAPPSDSPEARQALNTLITALKPKQKVGLAAPRWLGQQSGGIAFVRKACLVLQCVMGAGYRG